jgi:hypothetical protein
VSELGLVGASHFSGPRTFASVLVGNQSSFGMIFIFTLIQQLSPLVRLYWVLATTLVLLTLLDRPLLPSTLK